MNAAVLHSLGNMPHCERFSEPVAEEGEVVVEVRAASLKPVDRQLASGSHYASPRNLPVICGTDGVGLLADGRRIFFGGARPPYGAMAERTVVNESFTFTVPEGLDDATAAALPNPSVSAWLSLEYRARLTRGENVLILGATGLTGTLAVKIAKLLGAARVIAAGRNAEVLSALRGQGADGVIRLDQTREKLVEAFAREGRESGFHVVIDYVWGEPAEAFMRAASRQEFAAAGPEIRYVQAGENAGPSISLPASTLRSAPLTIMGTAGIPPRELLASAFQRVMEHAVSGDLHIDTQRVSLAEVARAWQADPPGGRWVIVPRGDRTSP